MRPVTGKYLSVFAEIPEPGVSVVKLEQQFCSILLL